MGLLLNSRYWAGIADQIASQIPTHTSLMSEDAAREIVRLGCIHLTELARDPKLPEDLNRAHELYRYALADGDPSTFPFGDFTASLIRAETIVFRQSNFSEGAIVSVIEAMTEVRDAFRLDEEHFDRITEKIAYAAEISCKYSNEPTAEPGDIAIWRRVWYATSGITVMSADIGTVGAAVASGAAASVSLGLPLGLLDGCLAVAADRAVGRSIPYGASMLRMAIHRLW